ncbi:MAG TPA: 8-oxo-dGTP diphosphatase [Ignavibacteriaceae bacterium]|nr:8-oxo-dGTP diphosphatase [Ignavibacteriaceae bacterium]
MKLATLCYVMDKNNNSTLMIHRIKKENDYHEGKWNGLGGKFEAGESPEECAIREIKEESGLLVKSLRMRGFITFPDFDGVDDWYVFIFTADDYKGTLIDSPEGKLEWIPNKKVTGLNLWEGDKIFLEWLYQDKFFSAKFNYENGKYKDYSVCFY